MGPIRGLELALSSDTAGLGQSTTLCVCVSVHNCVLSAGSEQEVSENEVPGNPLFLFWCLTLAG